MPLPGRLYHTPKRRQALRRNRCSSGFKWSFWTMLWSTYCAASPTLTRSTPIASALVIAVRLGGRPPGRGAALEGSGRSVLQGGLHLVGGERHRAQPRVGGAVSRVALAMLLDGNA